LLLSSYELSLADTSLARVDNIHNLQMSHFPPKTVHHGATRSNEPRENNTLLYPFKVSDPRQLV
jgi:hypothetical protein